MDERSGIRVVPVGTTVPSVVDGLGVPLERRFGRPVRIERTRPPRPQWHDDDRGQYRADRILDDLTREGSRSGGDWMLAILDADLYAPGLSFVFGQATVGGCCAVIGLARLRAGTEDDQAGRERFRRRVLTEAVHELGHVAGLGHCDRPRCVMFFSNTIVETDRKGPDFCARCRPGAGWRAA